MAPESFTAEQFVAFNDELTALVHAGLPMEAALVQAAETQYGNVATASRRIAERMQQGASLAEALSTEVDVPGVYRFIVQVGVRSGNLTAGLEAMSRLATQYLELRESIARAFWYPMMVMVFGYILALVYFFWTLPEIIRAYHTFRLPANALTRIYGFAHQTALVWVALPPLALAFLVYLWKRSGRVALVDPARSPLRFAPWMGQIMRSASLGHFAQQLAVLVEQQMPLHEALELAGSTSGDRGLERGACEVARELERGASLSGSTPGMASFPAMLRWLLITGSAQGSLAAVLRHTAELYIGRALYRAEVMRTFLPGFTLVVVGGGVALLYGITIFLPMVNMYTELAAGP